MRTHAESYINALSVVQIVCLIALPIPNRREHIQEKIYMNAHNVVSASVYLVTLSNTSGHYRKDIRKENIDLKKMCSNYIIIPFIR